MWRSISIDGIATLTIATSRTVMKNAAPTIARVNQRRSAAGLIFLLRTGCRARTRAGRGLFRSPSAVAPAQASRVTPTRFRHNAVTHPRGAPTYAVTGGKHAGVPRGRCSRARRGGGSVRAARRRIGQNSGVASALRLRLVLVGALVSLMATAGAVAGGGRAVSACAALRYDRAYVDAVHVALAQREDVWGNALLNSPSGPTYEG